MSGVELLLAFLAGVVMGGALDRFVLPPFVDAWIGAAAALRFVLFVLLVLDVVVPDYPRLPAILLPLLARSSRSRDSRPRPRGGA
jgi:hypothetical protein